LIITIAAACCRNVTSGIKMKYTIALITILASLSGCSEDPPEEFDRIVLSAFLNNIWRSACVTDVDDVNSSYIPTLVFTSDDGTLYNSGTGTSSEVYYVDDTTCTVNETYPEPEIRDSNTFSYSLGKNVIVDGSVADITEATEIDTVNTTEGSLDFGAEEYDIFAIKDKYTLYFGNKEDPNNGTTIDLRPTQLDSVIYTR
jgi:hypothetical protein